MDKKRCIIFDFDGTLYPIIEFDSEQLLIHTLAAEADNAYRKEALRFIADDQAGCFLLEDFHKRYAAMAKRATTSHIDAVGRYLSTLVDQRDVQALITLKEKSGAHFIILSCGTENLAEAFLYHLGIANLFESIRAKRLDFAEEGKATLRIDIHTPEAKRVAVEELRMHYDTIIAVGDGPTDMPMLEAADLGLLIKWGQSAQDDRFETYPSLPSLARRIESYLESAPSADLTARR